MTGETRAAEMRRMLDQGATLSEVGRAHGVSRQRVSQILFPERHQARHAVRRNVAAGRLTRPEACARCGVRCETTAHHPDYAARLSVEWLCPPCHRREHGSFQPSEGEAFDFKINVRLHRDEAEQIDAAKDKGESRAGYVRAALREKLLRDASK